MAVARRYGCALGILHIFRLTSLHQFKNVGSTRMKMICTIPILPGGDGKNTTARVYA